MREYMLRIRIGCSIVRVNNYSGMKVELTLKSNRLFVIGTFAAVKQRRRTKLQKNAPRINIFANKYSKYCIVRRHNNRDKRILSDNHRIFFFFFFYEVKTADCLLIVRTAATI